MGYDLDEMLAGLEAAADPGYRAFTARLLPEGTPLLGVRTPALRATVREILRGDWRGFLEAARERPLHELRLMCAMVLGGARCPIDEKLARLDAFLPQVENWAVCDMLCASLKPRRGEADALFAFACACAGSDAEFRRRFGLVLLMSAFRSEPYVDWVMEIYRDFAHPGYFARMGAAWGLATLFPVRREAALDILRSGAWDPFTHNRAIQKMIESYRIPDEDKALLRGMKRRKGEP